MMEKRFHNLEHLTLLYASSLSRDSALEIMHLMKISPNAKVLILETRKYDDGSQKAGTSDDEQFISANPEDCWDLGISKECLLQHLEVVRIEVAVGCPNEFKLLEFLLKNAVALDSVTITGNSPNEENGWISFKKKVMKIPRASSKVRIRFF
ncbi:hypothetical protein Sjap_003605 [Stephania japonica]|uniref:FBD domain-containing protein n=1 Tax=Stephania japonica TaxID=461633 RepID=A0AAP0KQ17_9MAGN